MKIKKILITNTVALNTGDAAILQGLLKLLKNLFKENVEFIIYDRQPEIAVKYYPSLNFRKLLFFQTLYSIRILRKIPIIQYFDRLRLYWGIYLWVIGLKYLTKVLYTKSELQTLLDYSSADLVISTGGTYLVENYNLECRILDYQLCLLLRKKIIFYTQSLGPFKVYRYQRIFKTIFNHSALILLRDSTSKQHLLQIGVQEPKIYLTSDAAFALVDREALSNAKDRGFFPPSLKVAISVRYWDNFKKRSPAMGRTKYINSLRELTIFLVHNYQAKVTYLSTCQGIPEYYFDDSIFALEIVDGLPKEISQSVLVNSDFHSPKDLAELIKAYDLIISTRLHMAILALGVGVPVFPIAYEFKTVELFTKLGLGKWVIDIEEIEAEPLIYNLENFMLHIPNMYKELFNAVQNEYEQALESSKLIQNFLEL